MAGGELGGIGARTDGGQGSLSGAGRKPATNRSVSALIDAVFPDPHTVADEPASADDLQSLLAGAVRDLARRTATPRVCAWLTRPGSEPLVAAASWASRGEPPCPEPDVLAQLRTLTRATDLGAPSIDPSLARLADEAGLGCALAVVPEGASTTDLAPVVLALGGPEDRAGQVRPRTLALLEDVAARLRGPLSTSLARARLAQLDDAVRNLDRRAALGELVAEIVHEVRNPLVSVKTFLQLLPSRLDDREFLDDFRAVVVDEVTRLERLLDSVLQHARPSAEDETLERARVDDVFGAIVRLLDHRASERRVELSQFVEATVNEVTISRDALRQVVLNLTMNALDASPAGGRVTLQAHAQSVMNGRFVEIRVEDDGPGIDPADRQRVFEAFHSTRADRPGGLGLAISRRLVEAAGGSLRASQAVGGGAALSLRLRAAPSSPE